MLMKNILLGTFCIWVAFSVHAQTVVTGTVTDDSGVEVPGANVVVKGTTNGTTTDLSGKYSLSVPSDGILVYTFIGLQTMEVEVGARSVIRRGDEIRCTGVARSSSDGAGYFPRKEGAWLLRSGPGWKGCGAEV